MNQISYRALALEVEIIVHNIFVFKCPKLAIKALELSRGGGMKHLHNSKISWGFLASSLDYSCNYLI